jgi:hypothetical protein
LFPIKLNGPDVAMNFCLSLCPLRDVSKIHQGNSSHMLDTNRNSCEIAVNFNLTIKRWLLFSAGNAQLVILNKIAPNSGTSSRCEMLNFYPFILRVISIKSQRLIMGN